MKKHAMLPAPTFGSRRTKILRSPEDRAQLQGAVLEVVDDEGQTHYLFQSKLWLDGVGWSMTIKSIRHDIVSHVGPFWNERDAWAATQEALVAKGYMAE